ncbi:hypothetical protein [Dyella sp. Tek66A03]|uniref:hypothetical protein n=1 Tax=Dyella sp. Tek66A03 TaxID=3458298 RepID=UPI00403EB434
MTGSRKASPLLDMIDIAAKDDAPVSPLASLAVGDGGTGFLPLIAAQHVPKACADFDSLFWAGFRGQAMTFLSLGEADHVGLIREDPQRAIKLYDMINHAHQYSRQLEQWVDAMKTVHTRAQTVAAAIAQIYPNMGVGPNSSPKLEVAGIGHA